MALTLEAQQRLHKVSLTALFNDKTKKPKWQLLARRSHDYVKGNFPGSAEVRVDDVAKVLVPLLEVNDGLKDYLAKRKLTQKYWISDFADLILDEARTREWWNEEVKDNVKEKESG